MDLQIIATAVLNEDSEREERDNGTMEHQDA